MAKICRRHLLNRIQKKDYQCRLLLAVCLAAGISCSLAAYFYSPYFLLALPPLFVLWLRLFRRHKILKSGAAGERDGLALLKRLPHSFIVIADVTLHVQNKTAQLDYLILGPSGAFIVEVKNHGGVISGDLEARQLQKTKRRADGGKSVSEFYNPVFQVSTHLRLLRQLLNSAHLDVQTGGAVYFSNPRAELRLSGNSAVPLYSARQNGGEPLLQMLMQGRALLSKQQILALKQFLFAHCS